MSTERSYVLRVTPQKTDIYVPLPHFLVIKTENGLTEFRLDLADSQATPLTRSLADFLFRAYAGAGWIAEICEMIPKTTYEIKPVAYSGGEGNPVGTSFGVVIDPLTNTVVSGSAGFSAPGRNAYNGVLGRSEYKHVPAGAAVSADGKVVS